MRHISNQRKTEFVGDIFCLQSFWEGHGEILNLFYTGRYDLPEMLFHRPVEFPTAVTHKSLTGWSRLMDHRKDERVAFRNGIQSLRSFGQSETGN
jgi:hypothetical protein